MAARKPSPKKMKTWSELKKEGFKRDPEEAIDYLNASFEQNSDMPEVIAEAIRVVSESLGLSPEQIAKKANMAPSTIHKALGKSGNPTLGTLTAVLKTMGLKITVRKAS
jgi:DNA-binding phage protein